MGIETYNADRSEATAMVYSAVQLVCAYTEKTAVCQSHLS